MHGGDPLIPYPLLIFLGVVALGGYVLHSTVFGRYLYAIGGNRDAAAYSGIPVKRIETTTYVISAGLAGVAGICYAAYIGQMSQQVGVAYELYAIAAVVLGGCSLRGGEGTVLGIVIGSAMMKVIDNGINMFQIRYQDTDGIPRLWRLNPNWTFVIVGVGHPDRGRARSGRPRRPGEAPRAARRRRTRAAGQRWPADSPGAARTKSGGAGNRARPLSARRCQGECAMPRSTLPS